MNLLKQKPVTLSKALALLNKRQKEGELSYEQQNTLDYLQQFAYLPEKKSLELAKELLKLGVSEDQAILLANLLPKKPGEVKAVLAFGAEEKTVTVSDDLVKQILGAVKKFLPKK